MCHAERFVAGYLGGSITEGAGASDPAATSWRALTTGWLRRAYPTVRVEEVNAAIGGTGSDLGAFRCRRDLLRARPDLIFVEFAVNDGTIPAERSLRAMEGIVRQIRAADERAGIVFIYTITEDMVAAYARGETPPTVAQHQRVAAHYGIPAVNVGRALWSAIAAGEGAWEALLADGTHPTDAGYALYAAEVRRFLEGRARPCPSRNTPIPADGRSVGHSAVGLRVGP